MDFDEEDGFLKALSEFLEGWARISCHLCEPIRTVSREAVLEVFSPICSPMYLNQPDCVFTHVKIGNKIYKRKPETTKNCEFYDELPTYCHYCGIVYGNIHHIGCEIERCPKCGGQFVCCDCHDAFKIRRYYLPDDKKGLKIPEALPTKVFEHRLYTQDREAGLTTFIEHRLHDRKFMAKTSLTQLKELAIKFDRHGQGETFEEIWRNVLEFKEKSDKAYTEFTRRSPQKIRPTSVKWTREERQALK